MFEEAAGDPGPEPDPVAEPVVAWREAFWLGLSGDVEPVHIMKPAITIPSKTRLPTRTIRTGRPLRPCRARASGRTGGIFNLDGWDARLRYVGVN